MLISVVIPVYGCPSALQPLHERLVHTLNIITNDYEIIMVNDGCPKDSWSVIRQICENDENVVGINLSRNFGQIHATNAGIMASKGDYVVLMDCDLQDKPEGILQLYDEIKSKNVDIVYARRKDRKDKGLTVLFSKLFYSIYNSFVDGFFDGDIANFCIVKRKIVDEYCKIAENNKSFTTVLCWMGYDSSIIDVEGEERAEGKSSYNFSKKINLAIDMLTSQSNKPLKMCVELGFIMSIISMIYLVTRVVAYFIYPDIPVGWTSMIASVFLMGGIQLVCLGVVGIYVGNIFVQTKGRPEYFVKEVINEKNCDYRG